MKNPLVSVTISAYNHEKYVQDTIRSIINQTYQNIELIIIDDGSTDSTWQKIQEMREECERRFVRVHFETKENEGTCVTGNKLLSLAKGEYVYGIASDDMAKPEAIEIEENFLSENPDYALCVGDNEIIDSNGNVAYWDKDKNLVYVKEEAEYYTFGDALRTARNEVDFLSDEFGAYWTLCQDNYIPNGYLIRKSIYEKIGNFTKDAPLEDYWLMLQISKYSKMKYIDRILFSYRWHGANTALNDSRMRDMSNKTIEYEKLLIKNNSKNEYRDDVKEYIKNGRLYDLIGFPFVFQIKKYKKYNLKIKKIYLFNINILTQIKKYK